LILGCSCVSNKKEQEIRVYTQDYRLTGYNNVKDVPLIFFTTNTMFYIMLLPKENFKISK